MATNKLIAHGTNAGYRAELLVGTPCDRCTKAHRVYQTQFRPKGKREGLKFSNDQVIDQLWKAGSLRSIGGKTRSNAPSKPADKPAERSAETGADESMGEAGPSLGDRLAAGIRGIALGGPETPEYLSEEGTGYVSGNSDMYDDPGPDWQEAPETEYVINAQGLKVIQENLATYLSVVGITVEMIDPYCGPVLADNFDNIVARWSKVIAHYPKAADLFLQGSGGVIFTWIGALQATWPVLYAIYQHHLAKSIMVASDGRIYNKNQMPNQNGQVIDPLQPQFQYSAS
jgi:hypothetical protein